MSSTKKTNKGGLLIQRDESFGFPKFNENTANTPNNEELYSMIMVLKNIVEKQDRVINKLMNNNGEFHFKVEKLDEQVQIMRNSNRITRDRLKTTILTLNELGIIEKDIFTIAFGIVEGKTLPLTGEGRINAKLTLSRYNSPPALGNS